MAIRTTADFSIPGSLEPLIDRLCEIYGDSLAETVCLTMVSPKRAGYVLNPLAAGEQPDGTDITTEPPAGSPVEGLEGCFSVPAAARAALLEHPAVQAGAIYPINPASVLAAAQLGVAPEQEVLDLAAAPGGKTLQLAIAMANSGRIAAVEPVKGRFHRMRANLDRCGVSNTQLYLSDGRSIGRKVPGRFERVLLDTPCSSESRIRLDEPKTYRHWSTRKTKEMVRKQRGLIRSGFQALKPGGTMIYCTCAFSVEENELVVNHLLRREADADLLNVVAEGWPGLTQWQGRSLDPRLALTRRILPDELFDGFFIAKICKKES